MTEPKLCPTTLRWAAQRIRTLIRSPEKTGRLPPIAEAEQRGRDAAFDFHADALDNWAEEAELAEAKRKADPGCTCSPSPGAGTGDMLCPSCAGVYSKKFDAQLAASLEVAIELRAEELRGEPALTVDQDKVDEHYGRVAYEAWNDRPHPISWTDLKDFYGMQREDFIRAAKAVCVEMAKAMKAAGGGS